MTHVADSPLGRSGRDVTWTVCPVTLHALALASDDRVQEILDDRSSWRATSTRKYIGADESEPGARHLWRGIDMVTLRPWAHGRLTADLVITAANGAMTRFVDQDLDGVGDLPEAIAAALHGRPLAAYCDHPVLAGSAFDQTGDDGRPRGSASTIPVDDDLPARVRAARAAMLAIWPAPTLQREATP